MRYLRIFVIILLLITSVLFPLASATEVASENSPITHYTYPLNVNSPDWFSYTVLEKVEMLKIPDSILKRMTDDALVQAVADFPYVGDIYAYGDSISDGIDHVASYCSALSELLSRKSYFEALEHYRTKIVNPAISTASNSEGYDRNLFIAYTMLDIINTIEHDNSVENFNTALPSSPRIAAPKTPNGTSLPSSDYRIGGEGHAPMETYHDNKDQYYVETFGVTRVRKGSCVYNCHSYAWYDQSSENKYWIINPRKFWEDNSYQRYYLGNAVTSIYEAGICNGDIVVYGPENNSIHSAIFSGNSNLTSTHSLVTAQCISKWGSAGVFRHTLANVPADYLYSTIRIYR